MKCPVCGGKTRVMDSRPFMGFVSRYRKCKKCGASFFTKETVATDSTAKHDHYLCQKIKSYERMEQNGKA